MKMIEAIIRKERIEPVKTALEGMGILGMTVTQVAGRGRQRGIALQWRAGEYRVDLLPKAKLEIVLDDEQCDSAVETICKAAKTGKEGDGMIFVLPVGNVVRVRTNDTVESCIAKN
jgi:nitrogen regulatory protein P-II 1